MELTSVALSPLNSQRRSERHRCLPRNRRPGDPRTVPETQTARLPARIIDTAQPHTEPLAAG
ncbi:hypothetical protein BJY01DRAFT_211455 [Aspergillus pseudoustus]|uniref:Uncharacterized protein n=1 Tax=Aspergillus pseudoustus TaxID=1810923 RepID=A0ABR4K9C7_9EURO